MLSQLLMLNASASDVSICVLNWSIFGLNSLNLLSQEITLSCFHLDIISLCFLLVLVSPKISILASFTTRLLDHQHKFVHSSFPLDTDINIANQIVHGFFVIVCVWTVHDDIQIWTCDEGNMEFYGSSATILTKAKPRSILLLKIHKTHIARHHSSIFSLLYVKCLWLKPIGLWIHILLDCLQ